MTKEQAFQNWWQSWLGDSTFGMGKYREAFEAGYDFGFVEGYKEADTLESLEVTARDEFCSLTEDCLYEEGHEGKCQTPNRWTGCEGL